MVKRISLLILLLLPWQAQAGLRKLKQNTATTVEIHLVNASTGAGITGATVTSITAHVKKHSDTSSTAKTTLTITASGGSNDCVEVGLGDYNCEITAANADTLGGLTLCYSYSAAVTTCDTYEVSAASDPQFAGDFDSIPDIFASQCSGHTTAGSIGKLNCDNLPNLDAAVTTRMATYTQPTGFLAATFPGTVASPTNITAGTLTTVTNLTNMPTIPSNWLTATGTADDFSTEIATKLMNTTFEGAHTFKHFLQYGASALFGRYSSSGGVFSFRDLANNKDRIVYNTTATARTSVTLDPN
jgi:hypothetical protein